MEVNGYLRAASNAVIEAFARCLQFTVNAYEKLKLMCAHCVSFPQSVVEAV